MKVMKCINSNAPYGAYRATKCLTLAIVCSLSLTQTAHADSAGIYTDSTKAYNSQLREYKKEIKQLDEKQSQSLLEPIKRVEVGKRTRKMPPLPKKSVQYSHLVNDSTLKGLTIFENNKMLAKRPPLSALISVQRNLNPLSMDAKYTQGATLKSLLLYGLTNNLDIHIARNEAKAARYRYLSSLGQFLPDVSLGDNQIWAKGTLGLPLNGGNGINLTGPFMIAHAGFTHHVYQGGRILFGARQSKHQANALNASFHAGYSDTLTSIARHYYNLVLEETVLQIRTRAADTSEEEVRVATERFENGSGTNLDVLQARTQLSSDRQNLLEQQVVRRQAAIELASILNYDLNLDLQPSDSIGRIQLIRKDAEIDDLLKVAVKSRAELKQLSEQEKASKAKIRVIASRLHPTVDLGGSVYGLGKEPSNVDPIYSLSLNMQWKLGGLGTVDAAKIAAARVQARNKAIELQKKVIDVLKAVRTAFIKSHAADQNIFESDDRVASAVEELRLAEIRYQTGIGTHLDVLTAQRDYTQAQIAKAEAITNFNISQIQLIRELGLVSVRNLSASKPIL